MAVVQSRLGPIVVHDRPSTPARRNTPVAFDPARLRGFTVHYTGGPLAKRYPSSRPVVESDRQVVVESIVNHLARVDDEGKPTMADVGYNVVLGRSGEVWYGRGLVAMNGANGLLTTLSLASQREVCARLGVPVGLRTTNGYYQSILIICGTDPGFDDLSPAQLSTMPRLLSWLADHYRLARPEINGHRDVRATLCPGSGAYGRLDDWARLFTPTPIPTPIPTPSPIPPPVQPSPVVPSPGGVTVSVDLPVLRNGARDPISGVRHVRRLQLLLWGMFGQSITVDGIFGNQTDGAVRRVQAQLGLVVDGIVGRQTWTALVGQ